MCTWYPQVFLQLARNMLKLPPLSHVTWLHGSTSCCRPLVKQYLGKWVFTADKCLPALLAASVRATVFLEIQ
jgi:hypothetical protein